MTFKDALKVYLSGSKRARFTLHDIKNWNPNRTIEENGERLGYLRTAATMFAKRYQLPYSNKRKARQ